MTDLLTYVMSLKLRVTPDDKGDIARNAEYINPYSKTHSYRAKKIKEQRLKKSITENTDVIAMRVSSGLLDPFLEELRLHPSRKSYDFQWCQSSNRVKEGNNCSEFPKGRSRSVDYRFARLRSSCSQVVADIKIQRSLERAAIENDNLITAAMPWVPPSSTSTMRNKPADIFVHIGTGINNSEEAANIVLKKSPDRRRLSRELGLVNSCDSGGKRLAPTKPCQKDPRSAEERAELVARLTLYRAIRRAPWSPSRRKEMSSAEYADIAPNEAKRAESVHEGGNASETNKGINQLTGRYHSQNDQDAFEKLNVSYDNDYHDLERTKKAYVQISVGPLDCRGIVDRLQDTIVQKIKEKKTRKAGGNLKNQKKNGNTKEYSTEHKTIKQSQEGEKEPSNKYTSAPMEIDQSALLDISSSGMIIHDGIQRSEVPYNSEEFLTDDVCSENLKFFVLEVKVLRKEYQSQNTDFLESSFIESKNTATFGIPGKGDELQDVVESVGFLIVRKGATKGNILSSLFTQFPSALSSPSNREKNCPISYISKLPPETYLNPLNIPNIQISISHTQVGSWQNLSELYYESVNPGCVTISKKLTPIKRKNTDVIEISLMEKTLDFIPTIDTSSVIVVSHL